jgi:hypothetical protein
MSDSDPLLTLVRNHLDREAETVDPRPAFARLRGPEPVSRPARPWRRLGPFVGLAAAVCLLVTLWPDNVVRADPAAIVSEARSVHHLPLDRVYLVETTRVDADDSPPTRIARLFTRGDRFWIQGGLPGPAWAAGQEESGDVWIALSPRRGVRIAADEVGRGLAYWCEFHALRPERLLGEILRGFTLTREPAVAGSTVDVITAVRRPGPFAQPLKRAKLEIDRESKALRRAVLEREFPGRAAVTTTYTLIETRTEDDARYSLEGHLTAPYEVYTRSHEPGRRRDAVERLFGPRAKMWLKN